MAQSLSDIGVHHYFRGDYHLAEPYFQEAWEICVEFGDVFRMANLTMCFAHTRYFEGNFDAARRDYAECLRLSEEFGGFWPKMFSFSLGFMANSEGDYVKAEEYFAIGRENGAFHIYTIMFIDWGQALSKCGLGQWQSARDYLCASLKTAITTNTLAFMIFALPPATLILWNMGNQPLAVEMMALAFTHPQSHQGWFVKSPLGEHALDDMKADMGAQDFDEAWQRDLHETAAELLRLFSEDG